MGFSYYTKPYNNYTTISSFITHSSYFYSLKRYEPIDPKKPIKLKSALKKTRRAPDGIATTPSAITPDGESTTNIDAKSVNTGTALCDIYSHHT